MFNQRGFVSPILIWVVIGLIAIVAVSKVGSEDKGLSTISSNQVADQQSTIQPNPTIDPQVLTDIVNKYYSHISSRQFDQAWDLLSKDFQNYAKNYDSFVNGYNTTKSILVHDTHIQDLSTNTVFIKLQATDNNKGQIQTKDYSGTWKLIKEDGSWKLDTADIALLSVSPSSRALNVAAFVYTNSSPAEIEDWRNKHGIKKSNTTQEIHDQAIWMDQHPDVLALNEARIKQYIEESQQSQVATGGYPSNQESELEDTSNSVNTPVVNSHKGPTSYTGVGNTLYGSDGSSYNRIGNTIYKNDGTSYTGIGNTLYGSDGSSYSSIGNTTYSNDGTSYNRIGNTIYGSDGSSATSIGNTLYTYPGR